jgi:hypothetical protein
VSKIVSSVGNASGSPDDHEDRRSSAVVAFLGAGLDPRPTRATMVERLADASRTVEELRNRNQPVDDWLAEQMRCRGIRENAAVLAVLEMAVPASGLAKSFPERYPTREPELKELLRVLSNRAQP